MSLNQVALPITASLTPSFASTPTVRRLGKGRCARSLGLKPTEAAPSRRSDDRTELEALRAQTRALAHDFNNLLSVILMASETLVDGAAAGEEAQELAHVCLEAAERGSELLSRIVAATQAVEPGVERADCAKVVRTSLRFVRQAAPASIDLQADAPGAVACQADNVGLERAVLNLCLNAVDAMPDGGLLRLEARTVELDAAAARRLSVAPGRYARLTVRDTGMGMDARTLAQATKAFFTTKGEEGSGLGLASVSDFARSAGGALRLTSRRGHGTVATLFLPAFH